MDNTTFKDLYEQSSELLIVINLHPFEKTDILMTLPVVHFIFQTIFLRFEDGLTKIT